MLLAFATTARAAAPVIQSHRGGAERDGKPAFAEESMAGFRSAWEDEHTVLELDVKLSSDRVPVVIHDDTLDRTTVCSGRVDSRTWADLRAQCPSDVLGIDPLPRAKAEPAVPMASLSEVLAYAKETGAPLNIEIKNIPGEKDFDPTPAYADTVLQTIKGSGVELSQLIIQSFYPPNLDEAQKVLPGVATAFLTFAPASTGGAQYAASRGYTWWSPAWPVSKSDVDQAHALGLKVVPWTIDQAQDVREAAAAGVDAVITNDPVMAKRALGLPVGPPAAHPPSNAGSLRLVRAQLGRRIVRVRLEVDGPVVRRVRAYLPNGRVAAIGAVRTSKAGVVVVDMRLTPVARRALRRNPRIALRVLGRQVRRHRGA
jgi:glycerophosphoryl diester phosphodiesterase